MRRGMILAAMLLAIGCSKGDEVETPTLEVVAEQITFKSVERLGPHHMLTTIRQEDDWADGGQDAHDETMELAWNNWDSFHLRRVVRGAAVGETIMSEGSAYFRSKGPRFRAEIDSEPARLRIQTSWNVWDTAMEVFDGRIQLTEAEASVVDGRPVRHFKVGLAPLPPGKKIRSGSMQPTAIEGDLWLDESTAVRLSADVTGTVQRGGLTRTIHLHLRRSSIGEEQVIVPPSTPVQPSAELLRERLKSRPPTKAQRRAKAGNP